MTIKKAIIILVILAVVGGGIFFAMTRNKNTVTYTTSNAEIGKIIQTVSETGTVKSANEISLNFLNTGRIEKIYFKIGDKVKQGDLLAQLDYSTLILSKNEARANLDIARQSLAKLLSGATKEDIAVANANTQQAKNAYDSSNSELTRTRQTVAENIAQAQKRLSDLELKTPNDVTTYEQAVSTAETNLNNSKATYERSVSNSRDAALTSLDDKLAKANTALDTIYRTINDKDGKDLISVNNKSYLDYTKGDYDNATVLLASANVKLMVAKGNLDRTDLIADALSQGTAVLNKTFSSLDNCYNALRNSVISYDFSQTDLDGLKSNISVQQTAISAAISALQAAEQAFQSALLTYATGMAAAEQSLNQAKVAYDNAVTESRNALTTAKLSGDQQINASENKTSSALKNLSVAQAQLNKILARPTSFDISLAQSKIDQAQAALESVNKQIENSQIKAPLNGVITKVNYLVGEQVAPTAPAIALIGETNFEIEVLISEADINKLKTKDKVNITFDSFGEDVKFQGEVFFIEPAETVIQDVIYYKVKISFNPDKYEIKPGMTANVVIITAEKDNALIIPGRAVVDKTGDGKIVRLLVNNKLQEQSVTVGLNGDEGMIEILTGIKAGDLVVTYIKTN